MERFEQETIIRFDEAEQKLSVYTASRRVASKLIKAGLLVGKTDMRAGEITGWHFSGPSSMALLKPGKRSIRLGTRSKVLE